MVDLMMSKMSKSLKGTADSSFHLVFFSQDDVPPLAVGYRTVANESKLLGNLQDPFDKSKDLG